MTLRLAALPKTHLHVHFEGATRATTVTALAARHGLPVPDLSNYDGLAGFIARYRKVTDLIRTPDDLARLVDEVVADEAAQGVLYSEPMIGPKLYADRFGWPLDDAFAYIDRAFQQAALRHGVEVRYQIGINWACPTELIESTAQFAADHTDARVVAFGLSGQEPANGLDRYRRACAIARTAGLLVVPHAGETRGPHVVRAAVEVLGAARIAHGIRAAEDADLLRLLAERRIVCDVCPTSNVRLGAVASLPAHPLPTLIAHGVLVTVNADDPLLLTTTLTNEYVHAWRTWHLDDRTLADLALAGLDASGMTEATKTRIQAVVRKWLGDETRTQ
jgi:adenosine deaminase